MAWFGHLIICKLLPSGKRLHNYGKSPFFMGKSTIKWPFSIAMLNYQRVQLTGAERREWMGLGEWDDYS
jgi:hypothetical protein